jgi:hypothetical protein
VLHEVAWRRSESIKPRTPLVARKATASGPEARRRCSLIEDQRSGFDWQTAESTRRCNGRRESEPDLARPVVRERRCSGEQQPGVSAAGRSKGQSGTAAQKLFVVVCQSGPQVGAPPADPKARRTEP